MSRLVIKRAEKVEGFTQVANSIVRPDGRLSAKAVGVLAHLLSHEDGWETSAERLARVFADGEHAMKTALRELEEAGHLSRERPNTASGFDHRWIVHEEPIGRSSTGGESIDGASTGGKPSGIKKTTSKNTNGKNTNQKGSALRPTTRWHDATHEQREQFADLVSEHGDPESIWTFLHDEQCATNPLAWAIALESKGQLAGYLDRHTPRFDPIEVRTDPAIGLGRDAPGFAEAGGR